MPAPTYSLIKVKDVQRDTLILDNNTLRAVLQVGGINLTLLSEQEHNLVINQFQNFLNGLDFYVEILIVSRLENIDDYLKILHLRLENEKDPLVKFQLEEYINFLEDYLSSHNIMRKAFYVIVPYDGVVFSGSGIGSLFKNRQKAAEEALAVQLQQLETRVSYVSQALANIGLYVQRLDTKALIELLFELYNVNSKWGQIPKAIIEKLSQIKYQ